MYTLYEHIKIYGIYVWHGLQFVPPPQRVRRVKVTPPNLSSLWLRRAPTVALEG